MQNTTLKTIEEIILQKQPRDSNYISSMNSLFENIYNNYRKHYCKNDDFLFNGAIEDILEVYLLPNTGFVKQNIFLIKQLIILQLHNDLDYDEFIKDHLILSDLINIDINYPEWDERESWPYLTYSLNKKYFCKTFNNYIDSPIYVDENDNIKLKEDYHYIRFDKDLDYFAKLDKASFGSYLKYFCEEYVLIESNLKDIIKKLNSRYERE